MGEPGRPKAPLLLSYDERRPLEDWAGRAPEDAPWLQRRSQIVLACAEGRTNQAVAQQLGVSEGTVSTWRSRYLEGGPDGLRDKQRPGVPRSITDEQVEALIAATLFERSPEGTAWTQESMAKARRISGSSVGRKWREHGLHPRRANIFALSFDPAFVAKVRGAVGLYLNPPQGALVLCVDETIPIPPARRATPFRARPEVATGGSDDDAADASDLQAALAAASRQVTSDPARAKMIERDRDHAFEQFLDLIDQAVPKDHDLHVVVDYSSTKLTESLRKWLTVGHLRFELHTAPTYRWWMPLVERWLAEFAALGLGRSPSELAASINDWVERWNEDPRPFDWHKDEDEINYMLFPPDA
jgi:transposase